MVSEISKLSSSAVSNSLQILTQRQLNILSSVEHSLTNLNDNLNSLTFDIIGTELESTIVDLNELTGEHASKQIIDSIFRNFCIGK